MNTKTKKLLENYFYNTIKSSLNEDSSSDTKKNKNKRRQVLDWLRQNSRNKQSYRLNHAQVMRDLWHPDKDEEDAKRSLFSRKLREEPNKDGGVERFTDEEVNSLFNIMSNYMH